MMKSFVFPALLALTATGVLVMAVTGQLDSRPDGGFVQGEIDGTRIDVAARFTARVLEEVGRDGAPVEKGDLLLRLDGSEMLPRVAQAEEALAEARAGLEKLRAGPRPEEMRRLEAQRAEAAAVLVRAEQNHRRCEELFRRQAISKQAMEEAVRQLGQAVAQEESARAALDEGVAGYRREDVDAARASVRSLEARLEEVRGMAEDLELRSPVNGEISKILAKKGELVSAGYPLATLTALDDLWAVVLLREDQLPGVRMGRRLEGSVPALGAEGAVILVDYMAPMGSYATWRATNNSGSFDLKTFEVRARPAAPLEGLRPGMSVVFPYPFRFVE